MRHYSPPPEVADDGNALTLHAFAEKFHAQKKTRAEARVSPLPYSSTTLPNPRGQTPLAQ
jgi:hypothetical protein